MKETKRQTNHSALRSSMLCMMIALVMSQAGCKKDTPLTAQELVTKILTSAETWHEPTVTVDDVDYSDVNKDFKIKFENRTYTSSGGAPAWSSAGTWVFINEEATLVKLDGTREVTINSITEDILDLSFQWDENTFIPGRVSSVKGKQKFKLKKKK